MTLFSIVLKSMKQRQLACALTVVSVGLSVGLAVGILIVHREVADSFYNPKVGWDVVIGPGNVSDLQLVLSSVLNVQGTTSKLPYSFYEELIKDERVDFAAPFCSGGSYQNFPVGATERVFFDKWEYDPGYPTFTEDGEETYVPGKRLELAKGRWFGEKPGDAVVGAFVAQKTRLKETGVTFVITHGFNIDEAMAESAKHHEHPFTVVGIMKPTGTAVDKAIYMSLESWFSLSGHVTGAIEAAELKETGRRAQEDQDHDHGQKDAHHDNQQQHDETDEHEHAEVHEHEDHHDHEAPPKELWELTSIGVRFKDPYLGAQQYVWELRNTSTTVQAVFPLQRLRLFFQSTLSHILYSYVAIAAMVICITAIGIMVWIYNSMNERRRDIAIMRSLGASRSMIVRAILLESATLLAMGAIVGLPLGHVGVLLAADFVQKRSGAIFDAWTVSPIEVLVVAGTTLLGIVVGILPAVKAYNTDVVENLKPLA